MSGKKLTPLAQFLTLIEKVDGATLLTFLELLKREQIKRFGKPARASRKKAAAAESEAASKTA